LQKQEDGTHSPLHATHASIDLSSFGIHGVRFAGSMGQVAVCLQGDSVHGSVDVFGSVNDVIGIVINNGEVEGIWVMAGWGGREAPAGAA